MQSAASCSSDCVGLMARNARAAKARQSRLRRPKTWFTAVYLLCESRKGMSANQIRRMLGMSYKTAWYLCHRIRHAMKIVDVPMLDGKVEMDETFVGGRRHFRGVQEHASKS